MKKQVMAVLAAAIISAAAFSAAFAEEGAQEIPAIGSDASGQGFGVILENGTQQEITGIALRVSYGDFSENLLTEDVSFAPGEKVHFYCTPGEVVNFVPPVYDLEVTYADDTKAVLHTLPMGDAKELTFLTGKQEAEQAQEAETEAEAEEAAGEVTYIRFTSLSLGYEMDTLRRETEIAGLGEAFLKADYESKITYTGGGSWDSGSSSSGGSSGGSGNGGGGNGCLTDGIMF